MVTEDNRSVFDDLMRFKPEGMTPNGWAVLAGVSRTVWSDMRRHGNPSRRTLEKLLRVAGSSLAEFEALRIGDPVRTNVDGSGLSDRGAGSWSGAQLPGLPLLATSPGGSWGDAAFGIDATYLSTSEVHGRVARPASLARDPSAYAVAVVGQTMWPRFRAGQLIAVSASSEVAPGDDVLVKIAGGEPGGGRIRVLIKQLASRTADGLMLRQFSPDKSFDLPAREIDAVEKVVGELI